MKLGATIVEEVTKALRDVFPTLLNAREESNRKQKQDKIVEDVNKEKQGKRGGEVQKRRIQIRWDTLLKNSWIVNPWSFWDETIQ